MKIAAALLLAVLGRRRALGLDAQYELGSFELWSDATRSTVSGIARLQTVF